MKVYIAGPMSGIEAFNIPMFDKAAEYLRGFGNEVFSPAEIDGPEARAKLMQSKNGSHDDLLVDEPWSFYLARDFRILVDQGIEMIVLLPGWEESKGAKLELALAKELGIPATTLDEVHRAHHWVEEVLGEPIPAAAKEPIGMTIDEATVALNELTKAISSANPAMPFYDHEFVPYSENPERQRSHTGAVKDNRSKSRMDLLPFRALEMVGVVLGKGAEKYKPNNWRLGLSWSQTMGSIQRHLAAFQEGEDLDPETGLSHIAHAACQTLFLLEFIRTSTGEDDRWVHADQEEAKA